MFRRFIVPAAALAVMFASPIIAPALAQTSPAPVASDQQAAPQDAARGRDGLQLRVQQWHDRLGITPAQQPQWDAVVATLRDNAAAMRRDPAVRAVRSKDGNAVDRLQAAASVAEARAQALQRLIPPVQALYAAFSPEQQHAADQALDRMVHGREPHHRG